MILTVALGKYVLVHSSLWCLDSVGSEEAQTQEPAWEEGALLTSQDLDEGLCRPRRNRRSRVEV